jgi:hypothetical protein
MNDNAQITNTLLIHGRPGAFSHDIRRYYIRPIFDKERDTPDDMPHCCIQQRRLKSKVDFQLLAGWLRTCDEKHCHSSELLGTAPELIGMRVIDVKRRCVVRNSLQVPYAALSYTWGLQKRCCLTQENLRALEKEDALRSIESQLGSTIVDSIHVCEKLAIPYLWVDSLCIIQDDSAGKQGQILNMDRIYASAYVTLVAASEVYEPTVDGVPPKPQDFGLSRVSKQVKASQKCITVDGVSYAFLPRDPFRSVELNLTRSVWFTRAWYVCPWTTP